MANRVKILGNTLFYIALVGLVASLVLNTYYGRVLPRSPDSSTGHTAAKNIHGTVVYMSHQEAMLSDGSFYGSLLLGVVGGLIIRREKN